MQLEADDDGSCLEEGALTVFCFFFAIRALQIFCHQLTMDYLLNPTPLFRQALPS